MVPNFLGLGVVVLSRGSSILVNFGNEFKTKLWLPHQEGRDEGLESPAVVGGNELRMGGEHV